MGTWTRLLQLAGVVLLLALVSAPAQIHGVPPSVTSFGFGGSTNPSPGVPASVTSFGFGGNFSPTPGVRASVTSLGPNGYGSTPAIFGGFCCFGPRVNPPLFNHRHREHSFLYGPVMMPAAYPVPYSQVVVAQPDEMEQEEPGYDDGTLLLRLPPDSPRASARKAELPSPRAPEPAASPTVEPERDPVVAQPSTVLVFKDGHKAEVENYAIVGTTLFDFGGEGRTRKIRLADLDLTATQKVNDERGVDFHVPASGN